MQDLMEWSLSTTVKEIVIDKVIPTQVLLQLSRLYREHEDFAPANVERAHEGVAVNARWVRAVYDLRLASERGPGGSLEPMLPIGVICP